MNPESTKAEIRAVRRKKQTKSRAKPKPTVAYGFTDSMAFGRDLPGRPTNTNFKSAPFRAAGTSFGLYGGYGPRYATSQPGWTMLCVWGV